MNVLAGSRVLRANIQKYRAHLWLGRFFDQIHKLRLHRNNINNQNRVLCLSTNTIVSLWNLNTYAGDHESM